MTLGEAMAFCFLISHMKLWMRWLCEPLRWSNRYECTMNFQDTGYHLEPGPGQLAFGDLPGAWGRGPVPECPEVCDV